MRTSANSVFNNCVLLNTICDHLGNSELLCMMRTSRLGFDTAASRIWRSLDGVEPLLMLLAPTLKLSIVEYSEETMQVTLPPFSPGVFTRFNRYSAFVRNLDTSNTWCTKSNNFALLTIKSWSTLSLQVQLAPLLPNLEDFRFSGDMSDQREVIQWISTFVSPSVKTLGLYIYRSASEYLTTAAMLGLITQKAPKLEKLSHDLVIVPSRSDSSLTEKLTAYRLVLSPLACGHLQNLQHLTHLTIGGQFIDPAILLELSCLPKLQYLSIDHFVNDNGIFASTFKEIRLPMESFPTLQDLCLISSTLDDILSVWSVIPLVSGLIAATLQYWSRIPPINNIYDHNVLLSILPLISVSCPHLQKLTLDGMILGGDETLTTNLMDPPWIHMGSLSLCYLRLERFRISAESLKNVQRVWPRLTALETPEQDLTFQHLIYLSQLPELKKLSAAGFKDMMEQVPEIQGYGISPLQTIELTAVFGDRVKIKSVEKVARFLLRLWPELQKILYMNVFENALQPDLELLNTYIRVIQGVAKIKKKIATRHGSDAARLLLDESLISFET